MFRPIFSIIFMATMILSQAACSGVSEQAPAASALAVNQVGYRNQDKKYFVADGFVADFKVLDAAGAVVFEGKAVPGIMKDPDTGKSTWIGHFDALAKDGTYTIQAGSLVSHPFAVGANVYDPVYRASLRSFYFQRCGQDLDEALAGDFAHLACHVEPQEYHEATGLSGTIESRGGWHDAGDFGRYVHSAAVSVANMLLVYESHPERMAADDLNIPESGNQIPDFLDEMVYELDWMLTMQHQAKDSALDGGVHYMLNTQRYEWTVPDQDTAVQYVHAVSSVATADFAAVMAQAGRILAKVPALKPRGERYLAAARKAWEFLEREKELYPKGGFVRPEDTETGGYAGEADSNDRDDRTWAAVELFLSTGDERYHRAALADEAFQKADFTGLALAWENTLAFPMVQYVLRDVAGQDAGLKARLRAALLAHADSLLALVKADGYRDALESYYWGCSGGVMNLSWFLATAWELEGKAEYFDAALAQLHYLLGVNALGTTFVSGLGTVSPLNIHHAQLDTDDYDSIFPGLVAGGPNPDLADDVLRETFDEKTPPALCYLDHMGSYASNENCILYNAPVVAMAAWFAGLR